MVNSHTAQTGTMFETNKLRDAHLFLHVSNMAQVPSSSWAKTTFPKSPCVAFTQQLH